MDSCTDNGANACSFTYSGLSPDNPFEADQDDIDSTGTPFTSIESGQLLPSSLSYDDDLRDEDTFMDCDDQGIALNTIQETTEMQGSPSTAEQAPHTSSPPIYANAPVTVAVSCLLILTYAMRYSLTGEAIADLLQLIRVHCPSPNQIRSSLYHFRQYFQKMKLPVKFHLFCTKCSSLLTDLGGSRFICPNALCKQVC